MDVILQSYEQGKSIYLSEKEKVKLRLLDPDFIDASVHIQFTTPVNVINNPIVKIDDVEYTLQIQGEYFDYATYANQLITVLNTAQLSVVFSTNPGTAANQRKFSIKANKQCVISSSDYHFCLVYGFQPDIKFTVTTNFQTIPRKMWIYYFRELIVQCPNINNPKSSKGVEQFYISRQQYTFQSAMMQTIDNTYSLQFVTDQVCQGLQFTFNNEDLTQQLDLEGEQYKVMIQFYVSQERLAKRQELQKMQAKINRQLVQEAHKRQQMEDELLAQQQQLQVQIDKIQADRYKELKQIDDKLDELKQQPQTEDKQTEIDKLETARKYVVKNYKDTEQLSSQVSPQELIQVVEQQEVQTWRALSEQPKHSLVQKDFQPKETDIMTDVGTKHEKPKLSREAKELREQKRAYEEIQKEAARNRQIEAARKALTLRQLLELQQQEYHKLQNEANREMERQIVVENDDEKQTVRNHQGEIVEVKKHKRDSSQRDSVKRDDKDKKK